MKLHVRNAFSCTPEAFWSMYWDEAFDALLQRDATVQRELLEERREGSVLIRRLRFTPDKELPRAAAKLLGANRLIYEQENRWDEANAIMHWRVIPTILPGKLDAQGSFRVTPTPTGCEQIVEGVIRVNVRFIGGQIEKAVIGEVERSWEKTAVTIRDWLQGKR